MKDNTPIIIGVGQAVEPIPQDLTTAASHADMAGRAAQAALKDADILGAEIDWLGNVRIFSDSSPAYACPFGGPDKFPRAVAARIGASPKHAIYDVLGGQSPQTLVAEAALVLSSGSVKTALIVGGEALGNMRAAQRAGIPLNWSEKNEGDWTDRGLFNGPMIMSQTEMSHGLIDAMMYYGFIETALRLKTGRTVSEHRDYMANLIAPMSDVAAKNPMAMFQQSFSPAEISTVTPANRNLISPYLKNMVAKDGVNQGAAVLMTTVAHAKSMGVAEDKWVYLRGHAEAQENLMLDRSDLSRSLAMDLVIEAALKAAKAETGDIDHTDIYSCFPCVVDQAATQLDRKSKPMTLTGGLPFFGGPGNNYTLHGICEVVSACRQNPGSLGLAHGNGGWMSKQAVGIYSTKWADGDVFADKDKMASEISAQEVPGQANKPSGSANLESYIVQHKRGVPVGATVIGRLSTGERFYAKLQDSNLDILTELADGKLDNSSLQVEPGIPANKAWLA